jgi:hypothetical protein
MALAGLDRRWVMHINRGADKLLSTTVLNAFSYNLEKRKKIGNCGHSSREALSPTRCAALAAVPAKGRGNCDVRVRGGQGLAGKFGTSSAKKETKPARLNFSYFSRRKIQDDSDDNLTGFSFPLCLRKSVIQLSSCLSEPLTLLLRGVVRRFQPIKDTRVASRQPLGTVIIIFLF